MLCLHIFKAVPRIQSDAQDTAFRSLHRDGVVRPHPQGNVLTTPFLSSPSYGPLKHSTQLFRIVTATKITTDRQSMEPDASHAPKTQRPQQVQRKLRAVRVRLGITMMEVRAWRARPEAQAQLAACSMGVCALKVTTAQMRRAASRVVGV